MRDEACLILGLVPLLFFIVVFSSTRFRGAPAEPAAFFCFLVASKAIPRKNNWYKWLLFVSLGRAWARVCRTESLAARGCARLGGKKSRRLPSFCCLCSFVSDMTCSRREQTVTRTKGKISVLSSRGRSRRRAGQLLAQLQIAHHVAGTKA